MLQEADKMANYTVSPSGDRWKVTRNGASRASSVQPTQAAAYNAARGYSGNNGGGDVTVQGVNGQFRYKNTIAPGNDPLNIKG